LNSQNKSANSGEIPILPLPAGSSNSVASSLVYSKMGKRCPGNLAEILFDSLLCDETVVPTICELKMGEDKVKFRQNSVSSKVSDSDSGIVDGSSSEFEEENRNSENVDSIENIQDFTSSTSTISTQNTSRYSYLITCTGIMANVSATAQKHRKLPPSLRGVYSSIRKLLQHKSLGQTKIEYKDLNGNDRTIQGSFMCVACCLGPNTSKDINLAPNAKIGDGILHILVVRKKSRLKIIAMFLRATQGTHLDNRMVNCDDGKQRVVAIKASHCVITTDKVGSDSSNLCVDGEIDEIPASHRMEVSVSRKFVPFYS